MTTAVTSTGTTTTSPTTTSSDKTTFGSDFNTFLQMLTTQLKNQDPLSPLDTNQFTQQLVSFSQVEQAINANQKLSNLITLETTNQAVSALPLVGKTVGFDTDTTMLADGTARYTYSLPSGAAATQLTVTDAAGRTVWAGQGEIDAGSHDFTWDGKDNNGNTVAAGAYKLSVKAISDAGKVIDTTVGAYGKVDGVVVESGQVMATIGDLKIPVTKMLSISSAIN